jgi:hypothetical protein
LKRTVLGSVVQALGAAIALAGLYLLAGLAVTLLLGGAAAVGLGVLVETGRL